MNRPRPLSLLASAMMAILAFTDIVNAQEATTDEKDKSARHQTLITNARIFDGKSEKLTNSMSVLFEGNKITRISETPITPAAGTSIIDARGRTLMPGLIDNRVHIVMGASSQHDLLDPKVNPETLQSRGRDEARQMLLRGFTATC